MMTDTKNALNLLRDARKLIEKEEAWTKWVFARNASGRQVDAWRPDATCFCLLGAIAHVLGAKAPHEWIPFADKLGTFLPREYKGNVVKFNDTHSHKEVIALLDKAIEAAQ